MNRVAAAILAFVSLSLPPPAFSASGPLRAVAAFGGTKRYALLSLTNGDARSNVTVTRIEIGRRTTVPLVRSIRRSIRPKHTILLRYSLGKSEGEYVAISYRFERVFKTVLVRTRPEIRPSRHPWSGSVPAAAFSLAGVALGAGLTAYWTAQREHRRNKFEWSKMLYERYEQSIRQFVVSWSGSTSAVLLRAQFERLRQSAWIPRQIEESYHATYGILASGASDDEKRQAADRLRDAFDNYIRRPWT
jgi:hypothetical protein